MKKLALAALLAFSTALAADGAQAAPAGIPDRKVDLDIKQARVAMVFRLIGDIAKRKFVLDPCANGTVDLRMTNAPLPLVLDALASQLKLTYEDGDDGEVLVRCQGGDDAATLQSRVTVSANELPLPALLDQLAASARLAGVDYRATKRPAVTVTLKDVRLATAVTVLAESSGLRVSVRGGRLVVGEGT